MNKTLVMNIDETRQNLIKICNTSNLPVCVLDMIIKDIYVEIHTLSERQLQEDTAKYIESIKPTQTKDIECEIDKNE